MSETQGAPELKGNMFLFERPELLNKEEHGKLGLTPPVKRFDFCAKARAVPVTIGEISTAMRDYPIIFLSKENPIPLAVVGMIDDVNLFVDPDGNWEPHRYIPGYVGRYPLGLAGDSENNDRWALVIDTAFDGVKEGGDRMLFQDGEAGEPVQQALDFCKRYEQDRVLTEQFGKELAELDLIQQQSAQYTPIDSTEPKTFAQYFLVEGLVQSRLTN